MNSGSTNPKQISPSDLEDLTATELSIVYGAQANTLGNIRMAYYDDKYYDAKYYDARYYDAKYYDARYEERYSERGTYGESDRTYVERGTYGDSAC